MEKFWSNRNINEAHINTNTTNTKKTFEETETNYQNILKNTFTTILTKKEKATQKQKAERYLKQQTHKKIQKTFEVTKTKTKTSEATRKKKWKPLLQQNNTTNVNQSNN